MVIKHRSSGTVTFLFIDIEGRTKPAPIGGGTILDIMTSLDKIIKSVFHLIPYTQKLSGERHGQVVWWESY